MPPHDTVGSAAPPGLAVLTISDSRRPDTDSAGDRIVEQARRGGLEMVGRRLVADDPAAIGSALDELLATPGCDLLVATGGTGVTPRDVTVDTVAPRFERSLPGFGEAFRALSLAEVGPVALLSRACAGVIGGRAVFLLPGSPAAVELALDRLILPLARHLRDQLRA